MGLGSGFPDFIAYRRLDEFSKLWEYEVVFVESKIKGVLDKKEKEQARWYLKNGYCSKFLVSQKAKEGRKVIVNYKEFK